MCIALSQGFVWYAESDFATKAERLLNGIVELDLVSAAYALEEFDLCEEFVL